MVYTDDRSKIQDITKYLRNTLVKPIPQQDRPTLEEALQLIAPYTGYYTAHTNDTRMDNLTTGATKIFSCTEAAGKPVNSRQQQPIR